MRPGLLTCRLYIGCTQMCTQRVESVAFTAPPAPAGKSLRCARPLTVNYARTQILRTQTVCRPLETEYYISQHFEKKEFETVLELLPPFWDNVGVRSLIGFLKRFPLHRDCWILLRSHRELWSVSAYTSASVPQPLPLLLTVLIKIFVLVLS